MVLDKKKVVEIKNKLLNNIFSLPEESRKNVKRKIESMSPIELENFLRENVKMDDCVLCSIVENKVETYKIFEDKLFLVVLSIQPLAEGHCLIIPKEHHFDEKEFESAKGLVEKITLCLKNVFPEVKSFEMKIEKSFDHPYFSIIPIRDGETCSEITKEKLKEVQNRIITSLNSINPPEISKKPNEFMKEKGITKDLFKSDSRIP